VREEREEGTYIRSVTPSPGNSEINKNGISFLITGLHKLCLHFVITRHSLWKWRY